MTSMLEATREDAQGEVGSGKSLDGAFQFFLVFFSVLFSKE